MALIALFASGCSSDEPEIKFPEREWVHETDIYTLDDNGNITELNKTSVVFPPSGVLDMTIISSGLRSIIVLSETGKDLTENNILDYEIIDSFDPDNMEPYMWMTITNVENEIETLYYYPQRIRISLKDTATIEDVKGKCGIELIATGIIMNCYIRFNLI